MAKTGRKAKHYVTSWGETIIGLSRRPKDGRWRIVGTQETFTNPMSGGPSSNTGGDRPKNAERWSGFPCK